jgi:Lysozyme like domain
LGVSRAESGGYEDAVGDLDRTDDTWGPSLGLFQVRSLRHPYDYAVEDRFRLAWALTNRLFNAVAAYEISRHGTDWSPWSAYRSGAYLSYVGKTYAIRTGHERAREWSK